MCTDLRPIEEIYTDDYVARSTMPPALQACLYLATYENGRFISDAYFRHLTKAQCDEIDRWLVEIEHPLAYQPGRQEHRITSLVRQYGAVLA